HYISLNHPHSRNQLDCCTGVAPPLVQTQPSQNAESAKSALPFVSDADSTTAQNGSKKVGEEGELPGKTKSSRSSTSSQSSGSQESALFQPSKLSRTKSKILDKVRAFEERRHSIDTPKVPTSGISWAGFSQKGSCDSDDGGSKANRTSDERISNVALKRSIYKQRASSLEERPSYAQKVQTFQSKFSEELQRIKKLVGRPNIKKAFSTGYLAERVMQPLDKVEPIPQIIDRVADEKTGRGIVDSEELPKLPVKNLAEQAKAEMVHEASKPNNKGTGFKCTGNQSLKDLECCQLKEGTGNLEKDLVNKVPRKSLPKRMRNTLKGTLPLQPQKDLKIPNPEQLLPKEDQKSFKKEQSNFQDEAIKAPPKPPRLGTASTSPRLSDEGEETLHLPLKMSIPTIVIEDKPVNETKVLFDQKNAKQTDEKKKEGRHKQKPSKSAEQEDSSDDSYMSAEEDAAGGPVFKLPLRDIVVAEGSEVKLECIIAGKTSRVTWRKGDLQLGDGTGYDIEEEGGRHSLRISQMRPSDAGTYSITAKSKMGQASCWATLSINSESVQSQSGSLSLPLKKPFSSVLTDEKTPMEERMESPCFKEPSTFQVTLSDQMVTEGEDVNLYVQVCGQPKPVVCWFKDRVKIKAGGQHELTEMDNGKCELKIKSAEKSDAGVYMCKILNEYGTKQTECQLEVKAFPHPEILTITSPLQDLKVRAGRTALFECHMTGPYDVEVDWLANGKLIQPALLDCKMQFDGKRCRLQLKSVHEDDSGVYTCKLSTAKEELVISAKLTVIPSKEPLFTRKLDSLEVIEGRSARFDCKVSGTPPPEVTWTHCEQPVVESENIRFLTEGGHHSLLIAHVTQQCEGFYMTVAQNVHGHVESSAELFVQEPRPVISSHMSRLEKMPSIPEEPEMLEGEVERRTMPDFVKPLSDLEVVEGKDAVLQCKVTGMPYPTITWYHNGQKIDNTEDRKMTQYRDVHSLVIRSVCHGHSGVYKSVISNKMGKSTCYAHLYVTDIIPDPPDGTPVVEGITGKTITISWKPPKNLDPSIDPSSLVYTVQQQALGSIQWTVVASSLTETTYRLTSLTKGVRYAFRVLCSTGKALSKPSQPTDLVQLFDRGQYLHNAPVILDKPNVVYAVENQPLTISVTLNHVQATVTWKRRGNELLNKPGAYEIFMPDDDQHALRICRVKAGDIGQLICTANNQYGSDLCTVTFTRAAPPAFETIMEDLDVCVGETPRLVVVVNGRPEPDILWYKDNVLLAESSHFTFVYDDQECSLVVLNAQLEDSGVYTCTAKNLAGEISCKAELTVHEVKQAVEKEQMEDEGTILRRLRRLTDYYDIHKEIGRGAFSYVKRVTPKKAKLEYAAKFISARAKRKASALREMQLLAELDHERIVYFNDAFEKKNVVVIITELCHEELLERLTKKTTVLESDIRSCIRQILEGLSYLHQNNIIHLDIKPENILMADQKSDQIKICDFGNSIKITPNELQYCKYGTPEFIAPEIVNQTPISKATDIWPVGVITYLCLTGVSPFAGENDKDTLLNIRNSNVAFEESMFSDLCKEAKGFVIKLLVVDRLRPDASECLHHPWFKTLIKGKSISTAAHKQVLAKRKWQCSLISYKSKMMMRSIPGLLDDSSSHVSLAIPRNHKEGSPPLSSSSDSDEDIDELPFIPMPLTMMFSGSRMSLTEIHEEENVAGACKGTSQSLRQNGNAIECESSNQEKNVKHKDIVDSSEQPELNELSAEAEQASAKARRRVMRRGSSADSALILHITPEDTAANEASEEDQKCMKKAVSMEIPCRSNSPSPGKLKQEDYALKLELLRQRLLRGGSVDKKMSGLRGPLFETLGVDDEKQTASLDRKLQKAKTGATISEENKPKVFQKSFSFTQGDPEPVSMHRRFGAPLEIPSSHSEERLQEIEQTKLESQTKILPETSIKSHLPESKDQQVTVEEINNTMGPNKHFSQSLLQDKNIKMEKTKEVLAPLHLQTKESRYLSESILLQDLGATNASLVQTDGKSYSAQLAPILKITEPETSSTKEHPAVFAKVASAQNPTLRTNIKDIDSEEVFESKFKKRESSLTRGFKRLTRTKSEEKSSVFARKSGEEVYRPGPTGAPLEFVSRGLQEKSKSFQDLREIDRDAGLGITGRFSLRAKKLSATDRKEKKSKDENQDASVSRRRVTWALGRSKSLDKRMTDAVVSDFDKDSKESLESESKKVPESPVFAMRRKFESKVSSISDRIRSKSQEKKESRKPQQEINEEKQNIKKVSDSPVLAMRKKFESKVLGSLRNHSEDRSGEDKRKKTGLSQSQSEGSSLNKMDIPENLLVTQTACTISKESLDSTSSAQSTKSSHTPESDRRSRWDRWGLSRTKRDRTPSQSSIPPSPKDDGNHASSYQRSASDFPPVFHIKLKDHILLEGDPVTLSCLPAGSPLPGIVWMKDKKPLEVDDRMNLMASPDGRQLLMIMKTGKKDAGLYECIATNKLASATSSCTLSLASIPKCPGTPEIPQTYNNTALVVWKPADNKTPCTYTLERKTEGDSKWLIAATGIADCYYNVTDLPSGIHLRFRVACVNKAGQGPYSNVSERVGIDIPEVVLPQPALVKTVSSSPPATSLSINTAPLMSTKNSTAPWRTSATNTTPTIPSSTSQPSSPTPKVSPQFPSNNSSIPEDTKVSVTQLPVKVKSVPPLVPSKPNSPVNVVPPITQIQFVTPRPSTTPPSVERPMPSVPSYVPVTTAQVAPPPVTPTVVLANSISPIGDSEGSAASETPSGRSETALRQGVPQKPYTFLDERARGRFGVLRDCRENATGKMFMAKIVCYDQETKQSVIQEYEIFKSLHNDRIIALHEAYVTPRYLVLITEYCMGKEILYSLTDRFRYSEDDVVGLLVQILQGLEYLHNHRILHLDIKPDNIMVTNQSIVKIIDFGSAQKFNPLSLKPCSRDLGTLEYTAPEILKGDVVGPPADMWSLGVLTYFMLSGRLPFKEKDPRQTETKILAAKFDSTKLYPNVSQSALAFLTKILNVYPWSRTTAKDCFSLAWLQDSYLTKLRRQTLTFTTTRMKEFLGEHERRRSESATKHKVLLRVYQGGPQVPSSPKEPNPSSTSIPQ
ncbi:striated muscle preferentially expressed protein kinase, partial [Trichomycterus rosablanca]|uniref:striated muscle preferentially expressed protein kinase n=1 Tax=Trichomycterus rosablanca TaxID=2290929 RepID=UPI002F358D9F